MLVDFALDIVVVWLVGVVLWVVVALAVLLLLYAHGKNRRHHRPQ